MGVDDENAGRRRSRRRSSILKLPLSTIDVNKQVEEKPETKSRRSSKRVSFANYAEVKEFHEVSLSYNSNIEDSGNKQTSENESKEPEDNKISDIQSLLTGEIKNTAHAVENISDHESDEEMRIAVNPVNQSILISPEKVSTTTSRSTTVSQTIEDKENINVCRVDPEVKDSVPQAKYDANNTDKQAQDTSFLEKVMADVPLSSAATSSEKSLLFTNDFNCPASLSTELFLYNYVRVHTKDDSKIQTPDESNENDSLSDSPHLDKSLYQGNHTVYFDRNDSMDLTKPLGKYLTDCNESKDDIVSSPDGHIIGYYNQNNSYDEKTIYFNKTHYAAGNMDLTCCNTITIADFPESERPVEITNVKDVENIENFCENKQFNIDESFCKPTKDLNNPLRLPADNYMPPSSNNSIVQLPSLASKNIIDKKDIPCELNGMPSDNFKSNSNAKDGLGSVSDCRPSITNVTDSKTGANVLKDEKEHIKTGSKRTCVSESSDIPSKQSNTYDIIEPAINKPTENKSDFKNHVQPVTTSESVPEKLVLKESTESYMVESSRSCPKKTLVDTSQSTSKELTVTKSTKSFLNTQELFDSTQFNDGKFSKLAKELKTSASKLPADNCILPSSNNFDRSNLPPKNIIDKENMPYELNGIQSVSFRANSTAKDNLGSVTDFKATISNISNTRTEGSVLKDQKEHIKTGSKKTYFSETSDIHSKQSNTHDIIEPAIKKQHISGSNLPADNCILPSNNFDRSNLPPKNIIDNENMPYELNGIQSVSFRANSTAKDDLGSVTDFKATISNISNIRTEGSVLKDQKEHIKTGSKKTYFSETSDIHSKQSNTHDIIEPAIKKQNISGSNELIGEPRGQNLEFASKLSSLICADKNELNDFNGSVEKKSDFGDRAQPVTASKTVPKELVLSTVSHIGESSWSCPKKTLVDTSQSATEEMSIIKSTKTVPNRQDLFDVTEFDNDKFNKLAQEPSTNTSKLPADNCFLTSCNKPTDQPVNIPSNIINKVNIPGELNNIESAKIESFKMDVPVNVRGKTFPKDDLVSVTDFKPSVTNISNSRTGGSILKDQKEHIKAGSKRTCFSETSGIPSKQANTHGSQVGKLTDLSDTISSQNKSNHIKAAESPIKNASQITSCLTDPLVQFCAHDSINNEKLKDSDTNLNGMNASDVNILKTKEKAVGLLSSSASCEQVKYSSGEVTNEKEKKIKGDIVAKKVDNVTGMQSEKKRVLYVSMNTSGVVHSFNVEKSEDSASCSKGLHLIEKDSVETNEFTPPFRSSFTEKCKENVPNEIMPSSKQLPDYPNTAVDEQNAIRSNADQTLVSCNKAEKLSENGIQENKIQTGNNNKIQTEKHKLSATNNLTKLQNKLFNVGNVIENANKGEMKKGFSDCVLKINTSDVPDKCHQPQISSNNNSKKSNDSSFNTSNVFSRRQTCSETISSKLIQTSLNSSSFTVNKSSLMAESSIQPDKVVTEKCLRTDISGTQYDTNSVSEKTGFDFDYADVSDIMDEKPDFLIGNISHEDVLNLSPENKQPQSYSQVPSRSGSMMTDRSITDIRNSISTVNNISDSTLCSRLLMNMHFPHLEKPLSLMEVETIEDLLFLVGIDRVGNVVLECRQSNIYETSVVTEPHTIEEKMELACVLHPEYQCILKSHEQLKSDGERFMKQFKDPELLYGFRNVLEEREKTSSKEDIKKQLLADFKMCKQRTDKKMKQKKIEYFNDLTSAYTDKLKLMEKANSEIVDITSKLDQQIDSLDNVLKDFEEKIELLNSTSEYSEAQIKCYKEGRKYLDEAESIKKEEGILSLKCTQLTAEKVKLVETCKKLDDTYRQLQNGETPEQLSLEKKDIELEIYSILSPWKIWDLEDNVCKCTFWIDTLQLSLYTDSLKNVTEINVVTDEVWESLADDHPWLCLAHNMRKATLKEAEIFKNCTTIAQFSKSLHVFSAEMMKLQDLAKEIYSLSIKHHLKLQNNCITITYCCLKSLSKVMVDYYVDAVQYPFSFIKFEVKYQYGQISCEDIARRLRKVQPGLCYFTRLVNAVDLELAASKF
ncbi:uncharacterized protein LOC115225977 isoform X3 [Octopus sinensis]|uniref:Uncharacterized protein LOC115225977 isoform X2 n=1 Tax=Octopus sinensis TaxID=2607531 RepID=A0A7E6EJT5_9MOLL|nr:uncharacterized protein LOC115225977 isoform X2 [Octopus sinensis]XP_036355559.1 uncharacterized protein LOC115225977 isoform X3 [Octopus sinensis]